jgi:hypothetical protein
MTSTSACSNDSRHETDIDRNGPKPTLNPENCFCGAARQTGHSLRVQIKDSMNSHNAGQTGLMQMQPLLTQHLLVVAARNIWQRSIFAKAAVQTDQVRRISNCPFAARCMNSHVAGHFCRS